MSYFGPFPVVTNTYAIDSSENEYFGQCASGSDQTRARWTIFQKKNTGGRSNPTAWIIMFPVGPDSSGNSGQGVATADAMFIWANATDGTYTYRELGT